MLKCLIRTLGSATDQDRSEFISGTQTSRSLMWPSTVMLPMELTSSGTSIETTS